MSTKNKIHKWFKRYNWFAFLL